MCLALSGCTEGYFQLLYFGRDLMKKYYCPRTISPNTCSFRKVLHTVILLNIVIVLMTIYYLTSRKNFARYTGNHLLLPATQCRNLTQQQMGQLLNFCYKVHRLLDELKLDHWLMYGSLLGAYRGHAPLAWDDDADIGLDGDGRLITLSKTKLFEKLKTIGAKEVIDKWSQDGLIKVQDANSEFSVDLMIFHRSGKWMKRPGWASWLFYLHYNTFHTFPAKLIEQPLPKTRFGFFNISVPRNGNEMLKYLYPTDWWKVVKPSKC
ncbi:hypothetical protein ACROYT_G010026 [Oculina patagonica]